MDRGLSWRLPSLTCRTHCFDMPSVLPPTRNGPTTDDTSPPSPQTADLRPTRPNLKHLCRTSLSPPRTGEPTLTRDASICRRKRRRVPGAVATIDVTQIPLAPSDDVSGQPRAASPPRPRCTPDVEKGPLDDVPDGRKQQLHESAERPDARSQQPFHSWADVPCATSRALRHTRPALSFRRTLREEGEFNAHDL